MRGANVVETLILSLIFLLIGNALGIRITFVAFLLALGLACAIMLCMRFAARHVGTPELIAQIRPCRRKSRRTPAPPDDSPRPSRSG